MADAWSKGMDAGSLYDFSFGFFVLLLLIIIETELSKRYV
jgi:hypothetical protein